LPAKRFPKGNYCIKTIAIGGGIGSGKPEKFKPRRSHSRVCPLTYDSWSKIIPSHSIASAIFAIIPLAKLLL